MREQGGRRRAIWLKDTHINDFFFFFSQEITEIPSMETNQKAKNKTL